MLLFTLTKMAESWQYVAIVDNFEIQLGRIYRKKYLPNFGFFTKKAICHKFWQMLTHGDKFWSFFVEHIIKFVNVQKCAECVDLKNNTLNLLRKGIAKSASIEPRTST